MKENTFEHEVTKFPDKCSKCGSTEAEVFWDYSDGKVLCDKCEKENKLVKFVKVLKCNIGLHDFEEYHRKVKSGNSWIEKVKCINCGISATITDGNIEIETEKKTKKETPERIKNIVNYDIFPKNIFGKHTAKIFVLFFFILISLFYMIFFPNTLIAIYPYVPFYVNPVFAFAIIFVIFIIKYLFLKK